MVFQRQSFLWLLEQLLPPNDRICGCELWVPDTALFESGKVKLIVKTDKDGFMIQNKAKLSLMDLRRTFSIIVRERKKELDPVLDL